MREEEVKELLHSLCLESVETSVKEEPASEVKDEVCVKEESGEDIATLIAKLEELINKLSLILGEDDSEEESEDDEDDSEEDDEPEPQEESRSRSRKGRVSAYEQYNRSYKYRRYKR